MDQAWVVAVDMGYGHQRAAYPFRDIAYEGIITGVTDFGIFVEIIETKCEGMLRLSDMKDDFYEYDEKSYRVIGRRRKKIYRLGDKVMVRVKKTDVDRRMIDLAIEE